MRSFVYLAFILVFGCGGSSDSNPKLVRSAPTATGPSAEDESAKLQGTWKVVSITAGGNKVADDKVKGLNLTYVFEGNKVTVKRPDRADNPGTFMLDPKKTPPHLDLFLPGNGRQKCIYEMTGTTLRLCVDLDRSPDYPTVFESKAKPATDLLVLEKQ
jgi:uncharacterized protein (TIGR03067 family)